MDRLTSIAAQILTYGLDHPGLLVVAGIVSAAVGFIGYRSTKG